jgi:hypothetical protein
MKKSKGLMQTRTGQRLVVLLAAAILTTDPTDPAPVDPVDPAPTDPAPSDPAPGDPVAPDLATLFTPEEVEARQAEATRRAALTEEERAAEDQAKAEVAAANAPPEEYADFTVTAEGVVLDPEMITEFKPLAKEFGLNQEKAQKLVDLAVKVQQRTMDGIFAMHEERKATWLKEAKADPEIGADISKWDEKTPGSAADSVALRAFNTLSQGHPGMKAMVDELGIGNHPEFLRLMHRIGTNMREDTFEIPGTGGGEKPKSLANALWPGMK